MDFDQVPVCRIKRIPYKILNRESYTVFFSVLKKFHAGVRFGCGYAHFQKQEFTEKIEIWGCWESVGRALGEGKGFLIIEACPLKMRAG